MKLPCQKVLIQRLRRTHLISRHWSSAAVAHPPFDEPEKLGWNLTDGSYNINWFDEDMTPRVLYVTCDETANNDGLQTGEGKH